MITNHRRRRRCRDEHGASAVDYVIMASLLVMIFASLVQFGIRYHANRVAEAAAREGAVDAASWDGTAAAGRSTAQGYLDSTGRPAVTGSKATANRSATEARVTVTVQVISLVPWLDGPIRSTATAPVERFAE